MLLLSLLFGVHPTHLPAAASAVHEHGRTEELGKRGRTESGYKHFLAGNLNNSFGTMLNLSSTCLEKWHCVASRFYKLSIAFSHCKFVHFFDARLQRNTQKSGQGSGGGQCMSDEQIPTWIRHLHVPDEVAQVNQAKQETKTSTKRT